MLPLEDSWKLMLVNKEAELKLLDRRGSRAPYVGANLQTSRSPSAIDYHCRTSYSHAKRKLHSSRAKVRFYVAGDNNHSAIYAVSPQRFASFDSLLGRLTKTPLCSDKSDKERYIFSLNGSRKITALDELQSGESYVCATYEVFEQLSDDKARPASTISKYKSLQNAALAAARPTHTSQSSRSKQSVQAEVKEQTEENIFLAEMKPRLITVLKGGIKPRRSVRVLLNKKNTRSFEQIIDGIGDIVCPGEQVKRLFGISGRLVMCLADFYLEDSVFFAYANEKMCPEDLVLDQTEVKFVGAYRFRQASAFGRVTLTSHQKGMTNERPRSIPASALRDVYRMSSESRVASRTRSTRQSVPSTPKHQNIESETIEPIEKKDREVFKDASDPIASRTGSQGSIRTMTPKSDKSQNSINLNPSHSPSARLPPSSPTNLISARQSPAKEHHPSGASTAARRTPSKEHYSSGATPSAEQSLVKESDAEEASTSARQSPTKQRHTSGASNAGKTSLTPSNTKSSFPSKALAEDSQENSVTETNEKTAESSSSPERSRRPSTQTKKSATVRDSVEIDEKKMGGDMIENSAPREPTKSPAKEGTHERIPSNDNLLTSAPARGSSNSLSSEGKQASRKNSTASIKSNSPIHKPDVESRPESVASKLSDQSSPVSALEEKQSLASRTGTPDSTTAAETRQPDMTAKESREQTERSTTDAKPTESTVPEAEQTSLLSEFTSSHKDEPAIPAETSIATKDKSPSSPNDTQEGRLSANKLSTGKADSVSKLSETGKAETASKSSGVNEDDYSVDFDETPPGPDEETDSYKVPDDRQIS